MMISFLQPQILILLKLNEDLTPKQRKLFSLAAQLKAGKGLTIGVTVLEGDYQKNVCEAAAAKQSLRKLMDEEKVKGFVEVLVCPDISIGINSLYVFLFISHIFLFFWHSVKHEIINLFFFHFLYHYLQNPIIRFRWIETKLGEFKLQTRL